ncbi:DUF1573 domain-containing protein [Ferruginibacter yonginensis]|uniref:DUF1573 domain-containing protein n=1 Tax=Ferruginibacter yonginensis TaxID=1310416 RepID=A0ABV8QUM4_9BACT
MKKILFAFSLLAISYVSNAQTSVSTVKTASDVPVAVAPVETLGVKETEYNFGKIPQGKPVTHTFTVFNEGKTAFKLDNVQASCGCTTPEWNKENVIEPGKSAEIKVGYNAAAEGPFSKAITITYNGTQSKVILIKGEVWKTPTTSAPANGAVNDLKN